MGLVARTGARTPPSLRILRSTMAFRVMKKMVRQPKTSADVYSGPRVKINPSILDGMCMFKTKVGGASCSNLVRNQGTHHELSI